jgi:RNA polymerase sigma-70 factor (ECF subfamily)
MGIHQRSRGDGLIPADPLLATNARLQATQRARAARISTARAETLIDVGLIRRFNEGDEVAFEEIVARHRVNIHALVFRFLHNQSDAEEITQDTFIRAHRGLAQFRGESSLSTWLHRIAFNLARNRYWYFFRRRRHLTLSLDCPVGPDSTGTLNDLLATSDADPARKASLNEFVVLISSCMKQMAANQREILTLRNLLHQTYDEIAVTLGTNVGTVKSRIARARGSLRELMKDACPEFGVGSAAADLFEPVRAVGRLS